MNDNGWGCAYRSFQTISSWLLLQKYTSRQVPTHREIQEALVQMHDKPNSFIGSRQWIGAFEISLCLDHFFGVTSKIMNLTSGSEFTERGREIAYHFENNGSPIMIGGGVLAYTMLGIDVNLETGDMRFLILDPHYVGANDPKVVRDKGWCGWKPASLFRADAFYNLCMPQRPRKI
eukprot:TRINITY_DN8306_c0_g1_i1.p1 TRINITY_DN8306_c0_g1~~TRINITY_DN8306_c0_g1_i1.p1  ORF type:complete len:176 (+),score=28.32 TRINITY_DN8306_c0_g1_i1:261-788(+)